MERYKYEQSLIDLRWATSDNWKIGGEPSLLKVDPGCARILKTYRNKEVFDDLVPKQSISHRRKARYSQD